MSAAKRVTPVFLDEDDALVAEVPPTPTDGAFRRGLFVMLLVLGMFAAFGYIEAKQARDESNRRQALIEKLLEGQAAERVADEARAGAASAERKRLEARSAALERLLLGIIAAESDPEQRAALEDFARESGIPVPTVPGTSPAPVSGSSSADPPTDTPDSTEGGSGARSPAPAPSRRPTPRPSPAPEPAPRPLPGVVPPLPEPAEPVGETVCALVPQAC